MIIRTMLIVLAVLIIIIIILVQCIARIAIVISNQY